MYYNNYFHIWSFYLNNALVDNIDIFMDDLLHANDSEGDLNKTIKCFLLVYLTVYALLHYKIFGNSTCSYFHTSFKLIFNAN